MILVSFLPRPMVHGHRRFGHQIVIKGAQRAPPDHLRVFVELLFEQVTQRGGTA